MKGIELLLIGVMVVLVAVAVPGVTQTAHGYVDIERLVPAETQEVEAGAGEAFIGLMAPTAFSHDTARIELLLPAESGEVVESGAGETLWVPMKPVAFGHDAARIELLLPAD
jgi:hypothetical protein